MNSIVEAARVPTDLSHHNPRVAQVRELLEPAGRRTQGRFAAEGSTLLEEAARSGLVPLEAYATGRGLDDGRQLAGEYERRGVPVYRVEDRTFARMTDVTTNRGLLAVFALPARTAADVLSAPGFVLLLAGVNDPGNAGTLVRSAEAFGAAGVLFGHGGADPFGPKVVRAAMGSLFRVPVATVTAGELPALAAASGRPVVASGLDGEDLRATKLPAGAILAVGNERRGVGDWLPSWDLAVSIPQRGVAESLNAAVAGSIVLYEAARCQERCQAAEND